jgi:uncharacterized lipoprotein YddW (UPF0748 family)
VKRLEFMRWAGASIALGTVPGCLARDEEGRLPAADGTEAEAFSAWTWVHGDRDLDTSGWRARFARLASAGVGAVLVGGGDVEVVSEAAHAEGLAFHRWYWTLNRKDDVWARENHPEWFTVRRDGRSSLEHPPYVNYYQWVCPSRPEVRDYLAGEIAALADDPRIDGVHLDYVRHCDVILPRGLWETYDLVQEVELPEFDFCYCDVCREQFATLDGRDPVTLDDPGRDPAWRRFRWDSVTGLVRGLAQVVHTRDKPISAAVFPTPDIARTLVRQSWDEWPLDRFFPMLYHAFYLEDLPWIGARVREGIEALGNGDRRLNAGLYLPDLTPEALAEAVSLARTGGASGVAFFESEGLSEAHLAALARVLM